MRSTYLNEDVELLLKDITGLVEPRSTEEREKLIQSGRHYCEMLPIEYVPTDKYMEVYNEALQIFSKSTADAVGKMADKIIAKKGIRILERLFKDIKNLQEIKLKYFRIKNRN